jgi:hypothetical protein
MSSSSTSLDPTGIDPATAVCCEDAAIAIGELGGRVSASSVRSAWQRRAAWSGYARAMQLQGAEIDEVDLFSWGCGLSLPGRARRVTLVDEFDAFAPWWTQMHGGEDGAWKDALPFTPQIARGSPRSLQALDLQRQYAQRAPGIAAWLALPIFVHRLGLSPLPLPCLVAGAKAFRHAAPVPAETVRATLRALTASARRGLESLDRMEAGHRGAIRAIQSEYRPGKLPDLLALSLSVAMLSPARIATALDLSIAGAGKLLDRAASLGLVVEVSGRRSWKAYLAPDLAVTLGLRKAPVGRPRKSSEPAGDDLALSAALDDFDRRMAEIDARLAALLPGDASERHDKDR